MIFVTVGTQLPFDRLIRTVDEWAGENRPVDIYAQIGRTGYRPSNLQWAEMVDAKSYRSLVSEADVLVAHAGIGSILTAMRYEKPILIMPRRACFGEHRNDHQVGTATMFRSREGIEVALDEKGLRENLEKLSRLSHCPAIRPHATDHLIATLRGFLREVPAKSRSERTV